MPQEPSSAPGRGLHHHSALLPVQEVLPQAVQILSQFLAEQSPGYTFVHSGSLAWKGRVLLLPGFSRCGKSTLVERLVKVGLSFYSDEYAVVDRDGLVHPFPRPLHRRASESAPQAFVPAAQLGWRADDPALPVMAVRSPGWM